MKVFFKYLKSKKLLDDAIIFLVLVMYTVGMVLMNINFTNDEVAKINKDLQDYKALEEQQLEEMKELNYKRQFRDLEQAHSERLAEIEEERQRRVQEYVKQQEENPGEIADEIEDAFGFTFVDPVFE